MLPRRTPSGRGPFIDNFITYCGTANRPAIAATKGPNQMQNYDGLRSFLAECEKLGEVTVVRNADWNLEIGALTETASELIDEPPALMFDEIQGYPKGFRVLSIPTASRVRMAIALGLPADTSKMEIVKYAANRIKHAKPIPPREVETGPVMQNIMRDNEV